MTLDSQEQKDMLLQIFNSVNIPVAHIEKIYELKKALENAEVKKMEANL